MPRAYRPEILWYRIFTLYFALTAALLITVACLNPPLRGIFLTLGVCLGGAFVPIVMFIYFLRGYRGNV